MTSPFLVRLGSLIAIGLCLAGCGRSENYRYKLTLAVNTPDGVKKASSVVEVAFFDVSIPARGTMRKLNGEALYLYLGNATRPLVALLTGPLHPRSDKDPLWPGRDSGPDLNRIYGPGLPNLLDDVARIARARGAHSITPDDLPQLVTFADVNDPATVIEVDPNDLGATLGMGISWNEITLESTDEPITTGIRNRLPWLGEYREKRLSLDGAELTTKRRTANVLKAWDFDQSKR
jgi:hypothetical protein